MVLAAMSIEFGGGANDGRGACASARGNGMGVTGKYPGPRLVGVCIVSVADMAA